MLGNHKLIRCSQNLVTILETNHSYVIVVVHCELSVNMLILPKAVLSTDETFLPFSEKDTMDVWCNGQNIETAVSMIPAVNLILYSDQVLRGYAPVNLILLSGTDLCIQSICKVDNNILCSYFSAGGVCG